MTVACGVVKLPLAHGCGFARQPDEIVIRSVVLKDVEVGMPEGLFSDLAIEHMMVESAVGVVADAAPPEGFVVTRSRVTGQIVQRQDLI